jgi:hypothetical protein
MKSFYILVLTMTVTLLAKGQGEKPWPATPVSDQIVLTEQFIRDFFPQMASRSASIELRTSIGVGSEPTPSDINFEIIDWCAPTPPAGVPQVGHTVLLCTEYDKTYRRPLWGTIHYMKISGKIVPTEGRLHGDLFEGPDACRESKPVSREDFIKRTRLDRLSAFMGKRVRMTNIEKEPEDGEWKVSIETGPPASLHSQYDFYLDRCGYITNFYLRN